MKNKTITKTHMFKKKFILFYLFSKITNIYNYNSDKEDAESAQIEADGKYAEKLQQEEFKKFIEIIIQDKKFPEYKKCYSIIINLAKNSNHFKEVLQYSMKIKKKEITTVYNENNNNPYHRQNRIEGKNNHSLKTIYDLAEVLALIQVAIDNNLILTESRARFFYALLLTAHDQFPWFVR